MINIVINKIMKGRDSAEPDERERIGRITGVLGIGLNFILFLVKGGLGLITNSISLTADAFNNLSDTASSFITIVGFKLANKEADKKHPYGHGRIEYLTGLMISVLVIVVGYQFVVSSVNKILHPSPVSVSPIALVILIISISFKVFIYLLNKKLGDRIKSGTLLATAQDALGDILTTSVVIIGLIIGKFTTVPIDGFIGVLIALYIIFSGIKLSLETIDPILGEKPDDELAEKMKELIISYPDIYGVHDLQMHNYGPSKTMATIDVEIPYDMSLVDAHNLVDRIERKSREELGVNLVIHMDPINNYDKKFLEVRNSVNEIAMSVKNMLSIHDFRYTGHAEDQLIIFEIVVDSKETSAADRIKIKKTIEDKLKEKYSKAKILIDIDLDVAIL